MFGVKQGEGAETRRSSLESQQTPSRSKFAKPTGLSAAGVLRKFAQPQSQSSAELASVEAPARAPEQNLGSKFSALEAAIRKLTEESEAQKTALKAAQESAKKQAEDHRAAIAAAKEEIGKTAQEAAEARAALAEEARAAREKIVADDAEARGKLVSQIELKLQKERDETKAKIAAVKQNTQEEIVRLEQDDAIARDELTKLVNTKVSTMVSTTADMTAKLAQSIKETEARIKTENLKLIEQLEQNEKSAIDKLELRIDKKFQAEDEQITNAVRDAKHARDELSREFKNALERSEIEQREIVADLYLRMLREVGDNSLLVFEELARATHEDKYVDSAQYKANHAQREAAIEQNALQRALGYAQEKGAPEAIEGIQQVIDEAHFDVAEFADLLIVNTPSSESSDSGPMAGSGSDLFDTPHAG